MGGALGGLGANVAEECLVEGHAVLPLESPGKRLAIARPDAVVRWAYVARADAPTHRWTGGASWPWFILRVYATWPLAVLEVSGTTLTLRTRFGWMAFFGAYPVVLAPADVRVVFLGRRFVEPRSIAIVTTDGKIFEFFRLGRPRSAILDALAQAGFPVDREERKGFRMRDWFKSESESD